VRLSPHKLVAIFITIFVLIGSIIFENQEDYNDALKMRKKETLMDFAEKNPKVVFPFLFGLINSESKDNEIFEKGMALGDPLMVTQVLLSQFFQTTKGGSSLADIKKNLDKVIENWSLNENSAILDYKYSYETSGHVLPIGWQSGMDIWGFSLLLHGMYEETGESKYLDISEKIISDQFKSSGEAGKSSIVELEDGCWISEYFWREMGKKDEFFVMNGNQYALLAIALLSEISPNIALKNLYQCGLRGMSNLSPEFRIEKEWPLYMLNPSTVQQGHYLIFETLLFDSLHAFSGQKIFKMEAEYRRSLIKDYFPIEIVQHSEGNQLYFKSIGVPHPYRADIYAIEIFCRDPNKSQKFFLFRTGENNSVLENFFIKEDFLLEIESTTCEVFAVNNGSRVFLYESKTTDFRVGEHTRESQISYSVNGILDSRQIGKFSFRVDPSLAKSNPEYSYNLEGRIKISPDKAIIFEKTDLMALELDTTQSSFLGISIQSGGKEYFRYYLGLVEGHNLILISKLGFPKGTYINSVESITLHLYTNDETKPFRIVTKDLKILPSTYSTYTFFESFRGKFITDQ
jgi:hypothetical protein